NSCSYSELLFRILLTQTEHRVTGNRTAAALATFCIAGGKQSWRTLAQRLEAMAARSGATLLGAWKSCAPRAGSFEPVGLWKPACAKLRLLQISPPQIFTTIFTENMKSSFFARIIPLIA